MSLILSFPALNSKPRPCGTKEQRGQHREGPTEVFLIRRLKRTSNPPTPPPHPRYLGPVEIAEEPSEERGDKKGEEGR